VVGEKKVLVRKLAALEEEGGQQEVQLAAVEEMEAQLESALQEREALQQQVAALGQQVQELQSRCAVRHMSRQSTLRRSAGVAGARARALWPGPLTPPPVPRAAPQDRAGRGDGGAVAGLAGGHGGRGAGQA
jgi:hypothetical protein